MAETEATTERRAAATMEKRIMEINKVFRRRYHDEERGKE
jgi:hypothetical protein